jgi:hypothetical protein
VLSAATNEMGTFSRASDSLRQAYPSTVLTTTERRVTPMFVPRPVHELLSELEAVLADAARRAHYESTLDTAKRLAAALPLVHRTGRPSESRTLRALLHSGDLVPSAPVTNEEQACGWTRALYFFLGSAAYPPGNVAFLVDASAAASSPGTFSAFDSGGLSKGFLVPVDGSHWTSVERAQCLAKHSSDAHSVSAFAGPYLAAHFHDPLSYVSRPQTSDTDFEVYHGLRSTNGDRRAWTLEVRLQDEVALRPVDGQLLRIVLSNRALEQDIPDHLLEWVTIADAEPDSEGDVARTVAGLIFERIQGGVS